MAKSEILKSFVLSWEGKFVNDPNDRGKATNKGVTIATYRSVFGQERTIEDLKTITDIEWLHIFNTLYWNKWRADNIDDQSIANLLVDWVWCSGAYGIRNPQYVLGVTVDGIVGPKTIAAINSHPDKQYLFKRLWQERTDFLKRIGVKSQKKFLAGWLRRNDGIKYGRLICNGGKIIKW